MDGNKGDFVSKFFQRHSHDGYGNIDSLIQGLMKERMIAVYMHCLFNKHTGKTEDIQKLIEQLKKINDFKIKRLMNSKMISVVE
eukprot:UN13262